MSSHLMTTTDGVRKEQAAIHKSMIKPHRLGKKWCAVDGALDSVLHFSPFDQRECV